jgi:hypothetical protein
MISWPMTQLAMLIQAPGHGNGRPAVGCLPPKIRNGEAGGNRCAGQEPAVENQAPSPAQEHANEDGHSEEPHAVLVGQSEAEYQAAQYPQTRVAGASDSHDDECQGGPSQDVECRGSHHVASAKERRHGGGTNGGKELGLPAPSEFTGKQPTDHDSDRHRHGRPQAKAGKRDSKERQ